MITEDIHVLAAAVESIDPRGNPLVKYKGLIFSIQEFEWNGYMFMHVGLKLINVHLCPSCLLVLLKLSMSYKCRIMILALLRASSFRYHETKGGSIENLLLMAA